MTASVTPIATLFERAVLIANPAAAGVSRDVVDAIIERLHPAVSHIETVCTAQRGAGVDAARDLADAEVDLIVAVGGDGTVREVAEGMARSAVRPGGRAGPALLALPAGSGNSTCRNLWGELEWAEVLDRALDPGRSVTRWLDLIHLVEPDVDVLLGASSGFLAEVLIGARQITGLAGRDRYYAAAAGVLADMPAHPTRVIVDGDVIHDGPASLAAVGGGRFRAYAFQFLPRSLLDDGELDVCVIDHLAGSTVSEVADLVPSGRHLARPEVTYRRGRRITIERTDGQPLVAEFDGEVWSDAGPALTLEILPGAVPALAGLDCPSN
ncbi:MAG TPA: diacylglycerol kinase family protein [Acidimicrobiales bacterium]